MFNIKQKCLTFIKFKCSFKCSKVLWLLRNFLVPFVFRIIFYFYEKYHWNIDSDWLDSINYFGFSGHFCHQVDDCINRIQLYTAYRWITLPLMRYVVKHILCSNGNLNRNRSKCICSTKQFKLQVPGRERGMQSH